MSFTGRKTESSGFEQPSAGLQAAVLTRIVDWGTQDWGAFGPKRRVQMVWEVAQTMKDGPYAGKHMTVSKMYTLSFNAKSNLMADLESWRGKSYGPEESIDLSAVLGKPCMLTLVEERKGDYTNVNVKAISAMPQGMPAIVADEETLAFNLDDPDWDAFNRLNEKTQEKIAITPEYKQAMGIKAEPSKVQRNESGSRSYAPDPVTAGHEPAVEGGEPFDDDIPFSQHERGFII